MSDIVEDNKELIRIIGDAKYPAEIQYKFLLKAMKEINTTKLEERDSYALEVQKEALEWERMNKYKYTRP